MPYMGTLSDKVVFKVREKTKSRLVHGHAFQPQALWNGIVKFLNEFSVRVTRPYPLSTQAPLRLPPGTERRQ